MPSIASNKLCKHNCMKFGALDVLPVAIQFDSIHSKICPWETTSVKQSGKTYLVPSVPWGISHTVFREQELVIAPFPHQREMKIKSVHLSCQPIANLW